MALTVAGQKDVDRLIYESEGKCLDGYGLEAIQEAFEEFSGRTGVPLAEVKLDITTDYGYYNEVSHTINVTGYRKPTEQEKEDRTKELLKAKDRTKAARKKLREDKEAKDRKEFERLSKKYATRGSIRAAE